MSFYLCSANGCNRKYKTAKKWLGHMKAAHNMEQPALPDPIEIATNTTNRSNRAYITEQEVKAAEESKRIEREAQAAAEQRFREENEERLLELKRQELEAEERSVALRQRTLDSEVKAEEERKRIEREAQAAVEQRFREENEDRLLELKRQELEAEERSVALRWRALDSEDNRCVICYDRPINACPVPCGHLNCCMVCLTATMDRGCPICRQKIDKIVNVFG